MGAIRIAAISLLTACLCLLLAPARSALAFKLVPPGNSAANQYTESLPGPGGNTPSSEFKGGGSPAKVLGAANAARLEALGAEGRAAAQLAVATAPGEDHSRGTETAAPSSSTAFSQVLRQLTGTSGSGGMGILLPVAIALTLAASLAAFLVRRRLTQGNG